MRRNTGYTVGGILSAGLALFCGTIGFAEEKKADAKVTAEGEAFFENKIRPLLSVNCFSCHNEKQQHGNLRLDSREALLKGGKSGVAIVLGKPEQSPLVAAIHYDGSLKMPPSGKLKPDQITDLTAWIKMGAPWTVAKAVTPAGNEMIVTPQNRNFWAFRPLRKPAPPQVKNTAWVLSPIDQFVLAKLEAKGLKPAPSADRRTLIRRATFDLIGLPPTPEETDTFLNDKSPNAYAKVVDRLLASPHYGERWGRRWLDVARYADSNGLDENKAFAYAYRYRDYVVKAFNEDKPYNTFVVEQLAGDLLPPTDNEELKNDRLTATGFLVLGAKVLAEQDKPKFVMDIVDEQIEVTSKAFLGLTIACARCHDHKFDPIPTKDYYAMAGIFKSTKTMKNLGFVSEWNERTLTSHAIEEQRKAHQVKIDAAETVLKTAQNTGNREIMTRVRADMKKYLFAGWELARQPGAFSLAESKSKANEFRLVVEAEKYSRGNGNKDFENYGKNIGVIHTTQTPTFAEWDITVPNAGNYQIEFRYASSESRPVEFHINGAKVLDKTAEANTGSFQPDGQKWDVAGVFALKAGKNTLKIHGDESIPHFDKLLVAAVKTQPGVTKTAEQYEKEQGIYPDVLTRWATALSTPQNSPYFFPLHFVAEQIQANPGKPVTVHFGQGLTINPVVRAEFEGKTFADTQAVLNRYAQLFAESETTSDAKLREWVKDFEKPDGLIGVPEKPFPHYIEKDKQAVKVAEAEVKKLKDAMPKQPIVMAVEESKVEDVRVHLRGSTESLGDTVPRRFLTVIAGDKQIPLTEKQSGRLELAQWIVDPKNPLPARVAINRIWQGHFGEALVRTPENWGLLGDRPVHAEMVDWLASSFIQQGWSQKKMHRLIMLSNTYKMSTANNAKAALADPENRLMWRMERRRLEAEPFRDAMLFVSGKLDMTIGGSLLTTPNNDYVTNDQSGNGAGYNAPRRSLYLPIIRNALFDMFQAFDMGDPSMVVAKRATTTVAPQALYVMNNPFVLEQAKALADGLLSDKAATDTKRIERTYLKLFSRPPHSAEVAEGIAYLAKYAAALEAKEKDADKRRKMAWDSLCQILLASNEFIYVN